MECLSKADKVQKKKELRRNLHKLRNLVNSNTAVKVEEQGMNQFRLNVMSASEDGKNYLALIMGALEEKEISFKNANVSRCLGFEMEAVIEVTQAMDSSVLSEIVIQAIESNGGSN
uniref:Uncharacterized protein n=1 Tax=Chenopodium quinoa TaxID=63459 RepID=A0A803N7S5_CHEQI